MLLYYKENLSHGMFIIKFVIESPMGLYYKSKILSFPQKRKSISSCFYWIHVPQALPSVAFAGMPKKVDSALMIQPP
jgi:hypothetical protein